MKHTVLFTDGGEYDEDEPLYFDTEELVAFLSEQVKCEIEGDFLRIEIHTWESSASVEKKRDMSACYKDEPTTLGRGSPAIDRTATPTGPSTS